MWRIGHTNNLVTIVQRSRWLGDTDVPNDRRRGGENEFVNSKVATGRTLGSGDDVCHIWCVELVVRGLVAIVER